MHPQQGCGLHQADSRHLKEGTGWQVWEASVNLKKCNKVKCRVLYPDLGNFSYQYRLRDKWIENSPMEDLETLTDEKNYIWVGNICLCLRKPTIPWAASKEVCRAGWRRGFCPLFSWEQRSSAPRVLHPGVESPAGERREPAGAWGPKVGHSKSEGWGNPPKIKGLESWCCSVWRKEGLGETSLHLSSRGWSLKKRERFFDQCVQWQDKGHWKIVDQCYI